MNKKPLAYKAFEELADAYAAHIDTKPHNAFYDRPAVLSLLPDVSDRNVLDAGCGPGVYAEQLAARGAHVVACDVSERMLQLARQRSNGTFGLQQVDLTQPLTMFRTEQFDVIVAPLCLDYIEDWPSLFGEFRRILATRGVFIFSCGHPAFDAEYFQTNDYFSVERVECTWTGFGEPILMPGYRRSLEQILMPVINSGFVLECVHEPQPTAEFKAADPCRYESLMHRPSFLCVRARKGE